LFRLIGVLSPSSAYLLAAPAGTTVTM
jgi:hypothetical protein